jgi:uncharacterized membrane protein YbhN (UPF0104 family)
MNLPLLRVALGAVLMAVLGIGMASTAAGRGAAARVLADLAHAKPAWLVAAGAACSVAILGSAAAWHRGLRWCGGTAGYGEVSARYAVGSLLNAVAPAHAGSAVRLGLLSQTLPGTDRVLRAGGVGAAMTALRALALALLATAAVLGGAFPVWTVALLGSLALAMLLALGLVSCRARGRLAQILAIFEVLRQSRSEAAALAGWIVAALCARVLGAAAVATALSVSRPATAGVVLVVAMSLSGILPLTPGNFGTGAGAAALALHGLGISSGVALATGVAFQAVETATGVILGLAGTGAVTAPGSRVRRWSLGLVGGAAALMAAGLGLASLDLV